MSGGHQRRVRALEDIERQLLKEADLTVVVSHSMLTHFAEKYGLEPRRSLLIPCCVDPQDGVGEPSIVRERARDRLGLGDAPVVAYVGTLTAWQWPEAMFALCSQLLALIPSVKFLLLIPENDHPQARDWMSKAGLPEAACVLREAPHADVPLLLPAADVGLLLRKDHPVNRVSSPTKFGEYLAAGVPVALTSWIGDFSKWVRQSGVGCTVEPSERGLPQCGLVALVEYISQVQAERDILAKRCRALAATALSWSTHIVDLVDTYAVIARTEEKA
jgi:glycosyltransferase involved in cell wall biosynthesis